MRRRISFLLLKILILGIILFFYINNIFIPVKLKSIVINKTEEYLQREVTLGDFSFQFFKGFTIKDIRIYRKGDSERLFLTIDEISFNVLFIPTLKDKKIIISQLKIIEPLFYMVKNKNTTWNFSDLFLPKSTAGKRTKINYYLTSLFIKNGNILFTDFSAKEPFNEQLTNITVKSSISIDKKILFFIEAQIPRKKSFVNLDGSYDLSNKKLSSTISANNIFLSQYLNVLPMDSVDKLENGTFSFINGKIFIKKSFLNYIGDFALRDISLNIAKNQNLKTKLNAKNTNISLKDKNLLVSGNITLSDTDITLSEDQKFSGDVTLTLNSLEAKRDYFSAKGNCNINKGIFTKNNIVSLSTDLEAKNISLKLENKNFSLAGDYSTKNSILSLKENQIYKGSIFATNTKFSINNSILNFDGNTQIKDLSIETGKNLSAKGDFSASTLHFSLIDKQLIINTLAKINDSKISVNNLNFNGSPTVDLIFKHSLGENNMYEYNGLISLNNAHLSGIKNIKNITDIKGDLTLKTDTVSFKKLEFNIDGTKIELSGNLSDFKKPFANCDIKSQEIALESIQNIYNDIFNKYGITLSGRADIDGNYEGPLLSPKDAHIHIISHVSDSTISNKKGLKASEVNGKLEYDKDLLTFSNLNVVFCDSHYQLNGQLIDFSRPIVNANIQSSDIDAQTEFKILRGALAITKLQGTYFHSPFDVVCDVHFNEEQLPHLDLRGNFEILTNDLPLMHPKFSALTNKYDLKGSVSVENFLFKGNVDDWKNWQLTFDAHAQELSILNYPFRDSLLHYSQRDSRVSKCELSTSLYNGQIQSSSTVDLLKNSFPFTTTFALHNLNLEEMRKNKKIQKTDVRGLLSLNINAQGQLEDFSALTGSGYFSTTDAYLGEISMIQGLVSTVNKVPGFLGNLLSTITQEGKKNASQQTTNYITDIKGDFTIKNKSLYTENTCISGSIYDLKLIGKISFDRNLDMIAIPDYTRFLNQDRKATEFMGSPIHVKITGPINKPIYKPIFDPVKPLEKAVGTTFDILKEVGGILGGIVK